MSATAIIIAEVGVTIVNLLGQWMQIQAAQANGKDVSIAQLQAIKAKTDSMVTDMEAAVNALPDDPPKE